MEGIMKEIKTKIWRKLERNEVKRFKSLNKEKVKKEKWKKEKWLKEKRGKDSKVRLNWQKKKEEKGEKIKK